MVVTNISPQKRHRDRVNIFLDGEFAFGVHAEVLASFRLRTGDELDPSTIKAIASREEFNLAKQSALRLISHRLRSEKELRQRLVEKEFEPSVVDSVIEQLRSQNIVNDREFARAFVHDLQLRKPAGRRLLQQQLRIKGVPLPIIQEVLGNNVDKEVEEARVYEIAKRLVQRYENSRKQIDEEKQRQRLTQFLARRGFDWSVISPVIRKLFGKTNTSQYES